MSGSLTIRRAKLALPDRSVMGDVLVEDGVIAEIGPSISRVAGEEIDARGRWLLPGAIDTLVRLPLHDQAAVRSATLSALGRGVTATLFESGGEPLTDGEAVRACLRSLSEVSATHFGVFLAADPSGDPPAERVLRTPGTRLSLGWREPGDDPDPERLEAWIADASGPVVVDGSLPSRRSARLALYEDAADPREHARIFTPDEVVALWEILVPLARKHGRALHLTRVGSAAEVAWLRANVGEADRVCASVTAAHLLLNAGAVERMGVRAVVDPPLRSPDDQQALWQGLRDGVLGVVASGHETVPAQHKDTPYPHTPGGVPMASAWWPLLLDQVVRGSMKLSSLVRWTSEEPARRYGLPRLGRIEVGFDADLVLVDPEADVSVRPPGAGGLDWSPFGGFTLRGRPSMTILRGEPVWRDGVPVSSPMGRELGFTS